MVENCQQAWQESHFRSDMLILIAQVRTPAPGAAGRLMFTTSSGPTATLSIAPDFCAPGNFPGVGVRIEGLEKQCSSYSAVSSCDGVSALGMYLQSASLTAG